MALYNGVKVPWYKRGLLKTKKGIVLTIVALALVIGLCCGWLGSACGSNSTDAHMGSTGEVVGGVSGNIVSPTPTPTDIPSPSPSLSPSMSASPTPTHKIIVPKPKPATHKAIVPKPKPTTHKPKPKPNPTHTLVGIKAGQFCKEALAGTYAYDSAGDLLYCGPINDNHPHWHYA